MGEKKKEKKNDRKIAFKLNFQIKEILLFMLHIYCIFKYNKRQYEYTRYKQETQQNF